MRLLNLVQFVLVTTELTVIAVIFVTGVPLTVLCTVGIFYESLAT